MKSVATASARYVLAFNALWVFSAAVIAESFARANAAVMRLYVVFPPDVSTVDKTILLNQADMLRHAMAFFWPAALVVFGLFLAVYLLGRRHHVLWFTLLPVMTFTNLIFDLHVRLAVWFVNLTGENTWRSLMPDRPISSGVESLEDALGKPEMVAVTREAFEAGPSLLLAGQVGLQICLWASLVVLLVWPGVATRAAREREAKAA
jgi:hypothetical protein